MNNYKFGFTDVKFVNTTTGQVIRPPLQVTLELPASHEPEVIIDTTGVLSSLSASFSATWQPSHTKGVRVFDKWWRTVTGQRFSNKVQYDILRKQRRDLLRRGILPLGWTVKVERRAK